MSVLFLCPHGAAKSVLAAAAFQPLAAARGLSLQADCAGTEPDMALTPAVVALLAREGLSPPVQRPQLVTADLLTQAQCVISLGCALEELPLAPATWEQWDDIPPPSRDLLGAYGQIRKHLAELIETLASEQSH